MPIASGIKKAIEGSSWIRKMFEDGAKLKMQFGAENVFDFSLGNPNLEPPDKLKQVLAELAAEDKPGIHGYMPNAGFIETRIAVAGKVAAEHNAPVTANQVIMTVGAGGALNATMRAFLERGDEVLVPSPFFVEYVFYADNHGASIKTVDTLPGFDLDIDAMAAAISEKTRMVLINTPNNPTGVVYSRETLEALARLLDAKSRELGRTIYLVSDEPYRAIVYDGVVVPAIMDTYPATIVCSSFSKDLSLAGERIGYIAVNPAMENVALVTGALTLTNRILGFVNAPALMQRAVARVLGETVDVDYYRQNRDILHEGLTEAGYECPKPGGAFYLFVKTPIEDDVAFCQLLLEENILAVPGTGFKGPGYMRLSYCCSRETARHSLPGFARAIAKAKRAQ